jgi:hypothetical protein
MRSLRIAAVAAAMLALAMPAPGSAAAADVWNAGVGPGGSNGTATLTASGGGAGLLKLTLAGLRPSTAYAVRVVKGTCGAAGATLFSSAAVRTTTSGGIARSVAVPVAKLPAMRAAARAGRLTLRVGDGADLRCGVLAGRSTPACKTEPPTPTSAQTRARLGAYYFDGWTGPLSNFHFTGLRDGPFVDRKPLTGWFDSDPCVVEKQLATARAFGIDFFVFDWYFDVPRRSKGENLNSAFQITSSLPDRHGMEYAILYVNGPPFMVSAADWPRAVDQWVSYFRDPAYVRIGGKPLFIAGDPHQMRATFGSPSGVHAALDLLRTRAQAAGLPGVEVVTSVFPAMVGDGATSAARFQESFLVEGYDALTLFEYRTTPSPTLPAERSWETLADAARWQLGQATLSSPLPFIPMVMPGWDPRPWSETDPATGKVVWYHRSATGFGELVGETIDWADANPALRLEPPPAPPMVLLQSWNEIAEGPYLIPTVGEGRAYGEALAGVLTRTSARARSQLTLVDDGPGATARRAHGTLAGADGAPIASAEVRLSGLALDGDGLYGEYAIADTVPAWVTTAIVGFRVGYENGDMPPSAGACDMTLYRASFRQADGLERVPNGDFVAGAPPWWIGFEAALVPSDRGTGSMVWVSTNTGQKAGSNSGAFPVVAGEPFWLSLFARVAPRCVGAGYLTLIFLGADESVRWPIPLGSTPASIGVATTDGEGRYGFDLAGLGSARVRLDATYVGDATHWPAWVRADVAAS